MLLFQKHHLFSLLSSERADGWGKRYRRQPPGGWAAFGAASHMGRAAAPLRPFDNRTTQRAGFLQNTDRFFKIF